MKVTIAAAAPIATWRSPEKTRLRPVSRLTSAPSTKRATRLSAEADEEHQVAAAEQVRDDRDDRPDAEGEERPAGGRPRRAHPVLVEAQLLADQGLEGDLGILEDVLREATGVRLREPLGAVDRDELLELLLGDGRQLGALQGDLALQHLHLRADRDVLPGGHREGAGEEPRDPRQEDDRRLGAWRRRRP